MFHCTSGIDDFCLQILAHMHCLFVASQLKVDGLSRWGDLGVQRAKLEGFFAF